MATSGVLPDYGINKITCRIPSAISGANVTTVAINSTTTALNPKT